MYVYVFAHLDIDLHIGYVCICICTFRYRFAHLQPSEENNRKNSSGFQGFREGVG